MAEELIFVLIAKNRKRYKGQQFVLIWMVIRDIFSKAKSVIDTRRKNIAEIISKEKSDEGSKNKKKSLPKGQLDPNEAPNRFLRFYYNNRDDLLKERKQAYDKKAKKGICVRCSTKAVEGIRYCQYHQDKQKEYNRIAREKRKNRDKN